MKIGYFKEGDISISVCFTRILIFWWLIVVFRRFSALMCNIGDCKGCNVP